VLLFNRSYALILHYIIGSVKRKLWENFACCKWLLDKDLRRGGAGQIRPKSLAGKDLGEPSQTASQNI
jgi:hypothetical protein